MEWEPPARAVVVRLKNDRGKCDYRAGRSVIYQSHEPFWHFNDPPKWVEYYRRFSMRKPSTGLCAIFMAADRFQISRLYLPGYDALLDGINIPGHDMKAERAALDAMGLRVVDVRKNGATV